MNFMYYFYKLFPCFNLYPKESLSLPLMGDSIIKHLDDFNDITIFKSQYMPPSLLSSGESSPSSIYHSPLNSP